MLPSVDPVLAGSIGYEISHLEAISHHIPPDSDAIVVCEDDLEFLCTPQKFEVVVAEFLNDPRLDVLCLSGRPRGGSIPISENLRLVIDLVGRGCYVIKPHMVEPLTKIFGSGLRKLHKGNLRGKGDLEWRKIQERRYFFAFPRDDLAPQSDGFSDIERKFLGPR
jgi:hypothetical protein